LIERQEITALHGYFRQEFFFLVGAVAPIYAVRLARGGDVFDPLLDETVVRNRARLIAHELATIPFPTS
jgi:hypothetical protein